MNETCMCVYPLKQNNLKIFLCPYGKYSASIRSLLVLNWLAIMWDWHAF